MKKSLLIASTLAMFLGIGVAAGASHNSYRAQAIEADKAVYLLPNNDWKSDSARFAMYAFNDGTSYSNWFDMSVVQGTSYYTATVPSEADTIIFCRMDGAALENKWDNKWNQTGNLTVSEANGNIYNITGWNGGEWSGLTYHTSDPTDNGEGYYIVGTKSSWGFTGATKLGAGDNENIAKLLNYQTAANEEFKIRGYSATTHISQWYGVNGSDNYVADSAKKVNVYLANDEHLYVSDVPDVANETGYYLVGSKTNFKFENAPKLPAYAGDAQGNIAILENYSAVGGEKIKIHYYDVEHSSDRWSFYGGTAIDGVGAADGDGNFVFSAAWPVDIYVKEVNSELKFYVSKHTGDLFNIGVVDRFFEGKTMVSFENGLSQLGAVGSKLDAAVVNKPGYVFRGFYTNAACTTAFDMDTILDGSEGPLHAKYTKLGYYVTGDATYTGSADTAWKVDGATMLSSLCADPSNMLEGSVTIPNSASEEHPVSVKALEYLANGNWGAITYELGTNYSYVSLDNDSNFVFTKGGTFAVYVNHPDGEGHIKVWLNEGLEAFLTKFLSEVSDTCTSILSGTKTIENLKTVWADQKATYLSLGDSEKENFTSKTINDGKEDGTRVEQVIAKYKYIVTKYGTQNFEDFIWGQSYNPASQLSGVFNSNNDSTIIIVVIGATAAVIATGLYFALKKKHN